MMPLSTVSELATYAFEIHDENATRDAGVKIYAKGCIGNGKRLIYSRLGVTNPGQSLSEFLYLKDSDRLYNPQAGLHFSPFR